MARISLIQVGKTLQEDPAVFARNGGSAFRIEGLDLRFPTAR